MDNARFTAFVGCSLSGLGALPAWANTCAQIRPKWDPASGPVSAWGEAVIALSSPMGVVCLGALALAILTLRGSWLLAAGVGAASFGALLHMTNLTEDPLEISSSAATEGCTGPTSIAVAICAAICLICAGIYTAKRRLEGQTNA